MSMYVFRHSVTQRIPRCFWLQSCANKEVWIGGWTGRALMS
jgi:hypothetical protein